MDSVPVMQIDRTSSGYMLSSKAQLHRPSDPQSVIMQKTPRCMLLWGVLRGFGAEISFALSNEYTHLSPQELLDNLILSVSNTSTLRTHMTIYRRRMQSPYIYTLCMELTFKCAWAWGKVDIVGSFSSRHSLSSQTSAPIT